MSGVDLHPEELLDRVRRGQATAAERERVHAHMQQCEACRFEEALLGQGLRDAAPHSGDAARARAIEAGALAALAARGTLTADRKPAPRRRAGAWLAAAIVSSIATAAAAAVITEARWLFDAEAEPRTALATPKQTKPKPHIEQPAPAPVVIETPALDAPVQAPRATPRSAAELFALANEARRDRSTQAAVRAYRELLRAHPRSSEAQVARVALGRLLLDRADDPRGALRELDAYLAAVPGGALREEALIGRALALGRLGRAAAERSAWQALLEAYPASASADRARARLDQLR